MAIETAACASYLLEILSGVHQPGDVYKLALYRADARLGSATVCYSPECEVEGFGYEAGGLVLSGRSTSLQGRIAVLDFADAEWPVSTLKARGGLIYNASKGNRAVGSLDFGADILSDNDVFRVSFHSSGVVRIR